ncbi:alpha/beta hydrolase [Streptomyces triticirhizae]|uniref:DUF1023 domain-containing protein n=1 Tax=Streptomyces triticirhizae TaxID=2483353 RepID=A0A3M2M6U5_9ACTN|nr:alpha/beta hydrolase [Streptomyces triticirhizae]RMI45179.1 hypothetical protein EBN88_03865 [Streptomyces triticirhizae]
MYAFVRSAPTRTAHPLRRVVLVLAVTFAVLVAAGWLVNARAAEPGPLERQLALWTQATIADRPLPDPDAPAERIAAFFAALDPGQARTLADRYPLVVGNLPGAPLTLRYQANRLAIEDARAEERRRAEDARLSPEGQWEAGRRANRLASLLREDRQILAFDPSGRGRVAEVFGDLEAADRVSLVVPGVNTDLLTFERTEGRWSAPAGMARALYAEERSRSPETATATIAWADYDAPRGLTMSAVTAGSAETGAERLLATLRGLPDDAELALFCHSYGSVVCGLAADELPSSVTDIAVTGSPGMRAERVDDLGTTARVWAMRAEDDWIGGIPHLAIGPLGHGNDPSSPTFGARPLGSGGASGHDGYYLPGSASLSNLARVGNGTAASAGCAPEAPDCAPLTPCG